MTYLLTGGEVSFFSRVFLKQVYYINMIFLRMSLIIVSFLVIISCSDKNSFLEDQDSVDQEVSVAVPSLGEVTFSNILPSSVDVLGKVDSKGGALVTKRGFCWSTTENPSMDDNSIEATSVNGAGEFSVTLSNLTQNTLYYVRSYAINSGGVSYSGQFSFTSAAVASFAFANGPMFIVGSTRAAYDAEIIDEGGGAMTERGICWSTEIDPTVDDFVAKDAELGIGKYRGVLTDLSENTEYNLRSYAINEAGVSYGENIHFKTIKKGKLTYTLNGKPENPTGDMKAIWGRLTEAAEQAAWYIETYTSATKHVWINYEPGTPTADANNEGWMRFGTGVGYQNLRTMLHELNHTFGTGTTDWWRSRALIGGKYQLTYANEMLQMIQKDENATINGDAQHWWPYGLNQNNEVTSDWDYVYNCLLIEAMRKDGMTHSGPYTP